MLDEYHADRSQKENQFDQMPRQFRQKLDAPNVNRTQIAISSNKSGDKFSYPLPLEPKAQQSHLQYSFDLMPFPLVQSIRRCKYHDSSHKDNENNLALRLLDCPIKLFQTYL